MSHFDFLMDSIREKIDNDEVDFSESTMDDHDIAPKRKSFNPPCDSLDSITVTLERVENCLAQGLITDHDFRVIHESLINNLDINV